MQLSRFICLKALRLKINKMPKKKSKNDAVILVVSGDSAFNIPLETTFKELGFQVSIFDYRKSSLIEKLIFVTSLLITSTRNKNIEIRNKKLINLASKKRAAILFVSKGELIHASTIKSIRKLGTITINWFADLLDLYPSLINVLASYDYVFTPNKDDIKKYKKRINLYHLPLGGFALSQKPDFENRKYDVSFIGVWSRQREKMMDTIKDFNPAIWGSKQWSYSRVRELFRGRWLTPQEVLQVIQNSKIVVNIHQVDPTIGTTLNMRTFEATANGALLLTDYRKDLPRLFKIQNINKEVVIYKDFQDLKRKIQNYLTNDHERIEIAKRGFLKTIKHHNFKTRINKIFSIIHKNKVPLLNKYA